MKSDRWQRPEQKKKKKKAFRGVAGKSAVLSTAVKINLLTQP